jgi:hypothetical protein
VISSSCHTRLNTYVELKAENERLQRRVLELQKRTPGQSLPLHPDPTASSQLRLVASQWNTETSRSFYASSFNPHTGLDSIQTSTANISVDSGIYDGLLLQETSSTVSPNADEDNEEILRKKKVCTTTIKLRLLCHYIKMRRPYVGEQYVCITCGRTDSPEWRKVPPYLLYSV